MLANKLNVIFVFLALATSGPAFAADPDFHFLAADPSLRAQTQNANVVMGQATYVGKVLELDQPWEAPYKLAYPGSVVVDPVTGQWRMYYEMMKSNLERFVAMAVSDDGVNWTKPALNVTGTTYTSNPNNNFVSLPQKWMSGPSVFVDPNAPADQRYRMSVEVGEKAFYALASADGLSWRTVGTIDNQPPDVHYLDSHNVTFWDPKTETYMAYMRWWYSAPGNKWDRRGVFTKQSDTWDTTWAAPREFPADLDPKNMDNSSPNKPDIYTPGVMPYHGQYIGLPALYFHPDGASGAIYPTFMYSRDGVDWHFENPDHSIIDLGAHGQTPQQPFNGMIFTASTMPERDGNLYIYYNYTPRNHEDPNSDPTVMYLATLREDRFVGIKSTADNVGTWTTSNITLSNDPGQLVVNAIVRGSVGVEVLDPLTMLPFEGYAATDSVPITPGDYLHAVSQWNGIDSLDALAGQTVVLRFTMDDAAIYSFRFEPVPEPSTIALLLCGGACLLAFRWRRLFGLASEIARRAANRPQNVAFILLALATSAAAASRRRSVGGRSGL